MTERIPVTEQPLTDEATATPWAATRERLANPERGRTYWLATVGPDGRPHVRPLLGLWLDGAFYFLTGETTRKGQNLAHDPRCVITVSSTALPALDLILEGDAWKIADEATLADITATGPVPDHETVLRFPMRLARLLKEAVRERGNDVL